MSRLVSELEGRALVSGGPSSGSIHPFSSRHLGGWRAVSTAFSVSVFLRRGRERRKNHRVFGHGNEPAVSPSDTCDSGRILFFGQSTWKSARGVHYREYRRTSVDPARGNKAKYVSLGFKAKGKRDRNKVHQRAGQDTRCDFSSTPIVSVSPKLLQNRERQGERERERERERNDYTVCGGGRRRRNPGIMQSWQEAVSRASRINSLTS